MGWGNYFRQGNSTTVFHSLDRFVQDRMARWLTNKHGRCGLGLGYAILKRHGRLGLKDLVESIRWESEPC